MIAIDPRETWDYVLKAERETADPTVFVLGVLKVADEAALQDRLAVIKDGATTIASGTHTLEVLRRGLRGWRGFRFTDGRDVPFETNNGLKRDGVAPATDATLDYLPPDVRKELAEAIIERNRITEPERKNFSSAPAS